MQANRWHKVTIGTLLQKNKPHLITIGAGRLTEAKINMNRNVFFLKGCLGIVSVSPLCCTYSDNIQPVFGQEVLTLLHEWGREKTSKNIITYSGL